MTELPNKQPDDDLCNLFDAIVGMESKPNDYTLVLTVWSEKRNKPVSGMKLGMPWLGDFPMEMQTIEQMRKTAKDFVFYFDEKPRIMAVCTQRVRKRGKPATSTIIFSGRIPYQVIDEL